MRIAIHGTDSLSSGARAYIEYRMFSAIGRYVPDCERLDIQLTAQDLNQDAASHACSATLHLVPAGRIRVRATANRLYAAVDAAAERLARGMESRLNRRSATPGTGVAKNEEWEG